MPLQFQYCRNDTEEFISLYVPGEPLPLQARDDHPNWELIRQTILIDAQASDYVVDYTWLADQFDVAKAIARKFSRLSDRVVVRNGEVLFDGDVMENALTKQIVRFVEDNVDDWQPLVLFMENLMANPNPDSREQLYAFLENHDYTITTDGRFIGYKGVKGTGADDNPYRSIHAGKATVDGEEIEGEIPNPVGALVEMPRSLCDSDRGKDCSRGLHVAEYGYASTWSHESKAVLEVLVNPRDVVSVPRDHNNAKVRTCRYRVLGVCNGKRTEAFADVSV